MGTIWDFLKAFVGSRGVQILARYAGNGLASAATYFHLTIAADDAAKTSTVIGTLGAAALCWVIDHVSHSIQKEEAAFNSGVFPRILPMVLAGLLACAALSNLSGCDLKPHFTGGVSMNSNGEPQITGEIEFKEQVKQCQAAVRAARAAENASFTKARQEMQDAHNAAQRQYNIQLQNCSKPNAGGTPAPQIDPPPVMPPVTLPPPGAKSRALLVGIDKYPSAPLPDCVLDVQRTEAWLKTLPASFLPNLEVHRLRDEAATTASWLAELDWLTADLQPGDRIFFHNSCHGAETIESVSGQPDGHSQCVCPVDFDWTPQHMITDKQFRWYLKRIPPGVGVFWLSDSCHSGDLTRVPNRYYPRRWPYDPPEPLLTAIRAARNRAMTRALAGDDLSVAFISGCKYSEVSSSTGHGGLATIAFLGVAKIESTPERICGDMNLYINGHGGGQTPQVEGGRRKMAFLSVQ